MVGSDCLRRHLDSGGMECCWFCYELPKPPQVVQGCQVISKKAPD